MRTPTKSLILLAPIVVVLTLAACDTMNGQGYQSSSSSPYPAATNARSHYSGYGTVQSIDLIRQDNKGSSIGLGTLAGAVVGGVVGNQVGSGRGNTAATVIGAAGGGYVGHELENRNRQPMADAYRFTIRMEDGSHQTLMQSTNADIRVGDRVRVDNGVVHRY